LTTIVTVNMLWQNLPNSKVWEKVIEGSAVTFGDKRISIICSVGQTKDSSCVKKELETFSHFDTILACDEQTNRQTGSTVSYG